MKEVLTSKFCMYSLQYSLCRNNTGSPVKNTIYLARFEVFTAVTMKNGVFWDVTPCGSCKN
jgi:hypothetical protein